MWNSCRDAWRGGRGDGSMGGGGDPRLCLSVGTLSLSSRSTLSSPTAAPLPSERALCPSLCPVLVDDHVRLHLPRLLPSAFSFSHEKTHSNLIPSLQSSSSFLLQLSLRVIYAGVISFFSSLSFYSIAREQPLTLQPSSHIPLSLLSPEYRFVIEGAEGKSL